MKYNDLVAIREQLEIIRRAAERGLSNALEMASECSDCVDSFQHIIDEVAVTKALFEEE